MNILILGSGGREHAIAWKLSQSKRLGSLYVAPGNAGTLQIAENINVQPNDFDEIKKQILVKDIDMLVVGPEDPLANGIVDYLQAQAELKDLMIIGPEKRGATLESSKDFAKQFMIRHNIPTAQYSTFNTNQLDDALKYLEGIKPPYVLKADGLAAGKGVVILDDLIEAKKELTDMLQNSKFGAASEQVVIEEFLSGIEMSVFVLTDGKDYTILPSAKDYKRIGVGDTGPNTGGMGSISPVPFADEHLMNKIEERIIKRTISGLQKEGIPYKGFIFFGLIKVEDEPFVIEYNVRLGDPETESILPRIESDLVELFEATAKNNLKDYEIKISDDYSSTIILVSGGYPGSYEKGIEINGLELASDSTIFHAGTQLKDGKILTAGGRVIAVNNRAQSLDESLAKSFKDAQLINFEGKYFRTDIGKDL